MKKLIATIAIALVAALLVASPSHADGEVTAQPSVAYPLVNSDGSVAHVVYVEADRLTWRSRQAARRWDAMVPGLEVRVGACVPELPCVKVHVGSWGKDEAYRVSGGASWFWSGLTLFPSPTERTVLLNRERVSQRPDRFRVAMHEMGHALGLGHHDGPRGVMIPSGGKLWEWRPSDAETSTLVAYFAQA